MNAELVAKLRYMGRQYGAGKFARGGGQQKHYLEEAADEIELLARQRDELLKLRGHGAPCGQHCEAQAFRIEIRRLEALRNDLLAQRGELLAACESAFYTLEALWREAQLNEHQFELVGKTITGVQTAVAKCKGGES